MELPLKTDDMKRRTQILMPVVIAVALIASSCGPILQTISIETKTPAKYDVKLADKNISVFTTIDHNVQRYQIEGFIMNDSTLMVEFSKGFARQIEASLQYPTSTIPVYNHFLPESFMPDSAYIINLARQTSSDILIIVDGVTVQMPTLKTQRINAAIDYPSKIMVMPAAYKLNVYDAVTVKKVATITGVDTMYVEVMNNEAVRLLTIKDGVISTANDIIPALGKKVAADFVPTWREERRFLYVYPGGRWINAFVLASNFEWEKAMEVWMAELETKSAEKKAAAAFNIAVACEITEKLDLVEEWLNYAYKQYPLQSIESYRKRIRSLERVKK